MYRLWLRNWIVCCAVIVHGTWGLVLLFDDAPLHTTPLGLIHSLPLFSSRYVSAVFYLTATSCAVVPIIWHRFDTTFLGLVLSMPQQFLLMISFFTAVVAVAQGQYPDGYVPDGHGNPHLFIFVDQLWPIVGMLSHTMSLIDWYWWSRRKVPED